MPARRLLRRCLSRRHCSTTPCVRNTLSRNIEPIATNRDGILTWYTCGPTVYDSTHLGHARTYVSLDIVRRLLTDHFRFDVHLAMGMTDVDDKIIRRATEKEMNWRDLALHYESEFLDDMDLLRVRPPTVITRVSEHIGEIINFVEGIIQRDLAYKSSDGVYFDTAAFGPQYGKLAPDAAQNDRNMANNGETSKKDARDFALWKFAKPGEPAWDSPWGQGRPGWHIECSAMTHAIFGPELDLHAGGVDLQFPHHNNEIAQCEAHYGTESWCRTFIHTGHLHIKGLKMSKSLKNFITVRQFVREHAEDAWPAEDLFRMFCLLHRYSANVHFSADRMRDARAVLSQFSNFLHLRSAHSRSTDVEVEDLVIRKRWGEREHNLYQSFVAHRNQINVALADDFDTPTAISKLLHLLGITNQTITVSEESNVAPELLFEIAQYIRSSLKLFGLSEKVWKVTNACEEGVRTPAGSAGVLLQHELVVEMLRFRSSVRSAALDNNSSSSEDCRRRILGLCDQLRDACETAGLTIEDLPESEGLCRWEDGAVLLKGLADPCEPKEEKGSKIREEPKPKKRAQEVFNAADFSQFDRSGIPTHDAAGEQLSKRARKRAIRRFNKFAQRRGEELYAGK